MSKYAVLALALGLAAPVVNAETYEIDASHSSIGFSVRHMIVSTVRGSFGEFTGSFDYDAAKPADTKASAVIKAASIDTRNAKRDDHLRNEDFFDAPKFPDITFETTRVEADGGTLTLFGNLTMKGVTKEIALPVTFHGPITDPWGNVRAGFEGSTTINRQDWGISWSKNLDGGGLVVSDEVKLEISIEGIKK